MTDPKEVIGILAAFLIVISFIPYTLAIIRRQTKPSRATWFIWTILTIIFFFSYKEVGAGSAIWVSFIYIITTLITALLSIKYGKGGWTTLDKFCIAGCGISLVLWYFSGSAALALLAALAVDISGAIPTIISAYNNPKDENPTGWILASVGNGLNLFAILAWDFIHAVYPVYLFIMITTVAILSARQWRKK